MPAPRRKGRPSSSSSVDDGPVYSEPIAKKDRPLSDKSSKSAPAKPPRMHQGIVKDRSEKIRDKLDSVTSQQQQQLRDNNNADDNSRNSEILWQENDELYGKPWLKTVLM